MNTKLDQFHYHEAAGRLHIANSMIEGLLMFHPVIEAHPHLKHAVIRASVELGAAYQMVGQIEHEREHGGEDDHTP